jgi:chromosome partitioning protein
MPAVRTVAVINQKGGVGKTTTVANLGAGIASREHDVLLIDLDPQSHLTLHLAAEPGSTEASIYDVLLGSAALASASAMIAPHLGLCPSVIDLAAAEVELVSTVGREQILRDKLARANLDFEFVLIDCPPSLGLLTLNALAAADEVFIPLQPHFLALQGLGKLLETVSLVQSRINAKLRVTGVILCMYETGTRLASEVVADLRAFFDAARDTPVAWAGARIFETVVRRNVKLAECPSHGKTIFDYDPASRGAHDYTRLTDEVLAYLLQQPWPGEAPPEESRHAAGEAPSVAVRAADEPFEAQASPQPPARQEPALAAHAEAHYLPEAEPETESVAAGPSAGEAPVPNQIASAPSETPQQP